MKLPLVVLLLLIVSTALAVTLQQKPTDVKTTLARRDVISMLTRQREDARLKWEREDARMQGMIQAYSFLALDSLPVIMRDGQIISVDQDSLR